MLIKNCSTCTAKDTFRIKRCVPCDTGLVKYSPLKQSVVKSPQETIRGKNTLPEILIHCTTLQRSTRAGVKLSLTQKIFTIIQAYMAYNLHNFASAIASHH